MQSDQLWAVFAAATGGLLGFAYALKKGHYQNDKLVAKASLEIIGGCGVGFFVSFPLNGTFNVYVFAAFALGAAWAQVIQYLRATITESVRRILAVAGIELEKPDNHKKG